MKKLIPLTLILLSGCQYHDSISGTYSSASASLPSTLHLDAVNPKHHCTMISVLSDEGKTLDQFQIFLPRYQASLDHAGTYPIDTRGDGCFTDSQHYLLATIVNTQTHVETHTEIRTIPPVGPHSFPRQHTVQVQTTTFHQVLDLKLQATLGNETQKEFLGQKDFKIVKEY